MHAYKSGNNVRKGLLNIDVVGSLIGKAHGCDPWGCEFESRPSTHTTHK